ncbi:thermonuclease family protein [Planococcus koreensis]|uniref:thermonuclease family protein n=1 Tax=Planococcus koreensis TaxID=112331 RepID=UPI0039FCF281
MKKFAGLLLLITALSGCGLVDSTDTAGTEDQIDVEVSSVIDGDTIKIMYEGKEETVRYLLVDTPETNHPRLGEQPLGKEATAENKRIINSGDISIEFDVGERFDDYGRLLAYIYVDGESVQEQLLESGMARVAYVYPRIPATSTLLNKSSKKRKMPEPVSGNMKIIRRAAASTRMLMEAPLHRQQLMTAGSKATSTAAARRYTICQEKVPMNKPIRKNGSAPNKKHSKPASKAPANNGGRY